MPAGRSYSKRRAPMKRKASSRKKRVVRRVRPAAYVPKPEVKILTYPILDEDTNQNAPNSSTISTIVAADFPGDKKMSIYIPQNWQFNTQGTSQQDILGRQCFVQSMKHQFRLSFTGCNGDPMNPRLRIIHGWVKRQSFAVGTPMDSASIPSSTWGDTSYFFDCVKTHLAQQLQFALTKPNTQVVQVLSDKFYVPRATAGANTGTAAKFTRTAIETTSYWKMGRKLNMKIKPAHLGTQDYFCPQQTEQIPFTAFIWDNASLQVSASTYKIQERSTLRVIDN